MRMQLIRSIAVASCLLAIGCSRDSADAHAKRGFAYFDQGHYQEAIIELRNALQKDPKRGDVRLRLGDAYMQMKDGSNALGEYVRAADLLPQDATAQVKAGNILLLLHRFDDALARGEKALAIDPKSIPAMILVGNAHAGVKNFDAAVAEYEDAIAEDPSKRQAYVNLGAIQFTQGKPNEAEAAFKKVVEVEPQSVTARLALANFYWAAQRPADSESALKAALDIDPANVAANHALAFFYMATGRAPEAEPYFAALAKDSKSTDASLTLAQYYATVKRFKDARRVLEQVATDKKAHATATLRLAALDSVEGDRAHGETRLRELLNEFPKDASAHVLLASFLVADNKRDEALKSVGAALAIEPNLARAHALAAEIYAATDRNEDAIKEYEEVLKLDRAPLGAVLALARIHMMGGAYDKSMTYTRQALSIAPRSAEAQALLVRLYLAQHDTAKAKEGLAQLRKDYPTAPGVFTLAALIQLSEKQIAAADSSYARVLELDPKNFEAISGRVRIALSSGRKADAIALTEAALKRGQPSPDLLMLAGRVYASTGDADKSEALLRQAIDADPARLPAYSLLGELYARQNRINEAIARYQDVLARNPKSVPAVAMIGMLLQGQGKTAEAEKQYERALAMDPRATVPANNLAWLYVDSNRNLDQALQLAQTAQESLPDDAQVRDTLGWIYVRKGMSSLAIPHLKASVQRSPGDPVFLYHLGIAYVQTGDDAQGREALKKALELKGDFAGAADARKALAGIGDSD